MHKKLKENNIIVLSCKCTDQKSRLLMGKIKVAELLIFSLWFWRYVRFLLCLFLEAAYIPFFCIFKTNINGPYLSGLLHFYSHISCSDQKRLSFWGLVISLRLSEHSAYQDQLPGLISCGLRSIQSWGHC